MCATHGREVDDEETGEANFPIELLRDMKAAHEAKVLDAVGQAIEEEAAGIRTADTLLDTGLRPSTVAVTADGIAESLGVEAPTDLVPGLSEVRARLQRLSQVGLDALRQLLHVWLLHCHEPQGDEFDFGDPSGVRASVPMEKVINRIGRGNERDWAIALDELKSSGLLEEYIEDEHDYVLSEPWDLRGDGYSFRFWQSAAHFLHSGYGIEISSWVRTLDFSIFDRLAPADREVPWR